MTKQVGLWKTSFVALLAGITVTAVAHKDENHKPTEQPATDKSNMALEKISENYVQNIKPIFKKKCFDCHSSQTWDPWYRNLPGAKQLIDNDIKKAKEHLDMESDFPFKSHATPLEDLEGIEKTVKDNEMPPLRYRIMHFSSALTEEEKEKVLQWSHFGQQTLKNKK